MAMSLDFKCHRRLGSNVTVSTKHKHHSDAPEGDTGSSGTPFMKPLPGETVVAAPRQLAACGDSEKGSEEANLATGWITRGKARSEGDTSGGHCNCLHGAWERRNTRGEGGQYAVWNNLTQIPTVGEPPV